MAIGNQIIGKKYRLAGTEFEVTGDSGRSWDVDSQNSPDFKSIDKQTLRDALNRGDAEEVIQD